MKFVAIFMKLIVAGVLMLPLVGNSSMAHAKELPDLVVNARLMEPVILAGETLPLDSPGIREGVEKELMLALWNRSQVLLWMKRSSRIFPPVEAMLKQEGLPDDLKYVMVVESSLRPHAGSSKGAVGYWQFIKSTALKYGLRVDDCVDDRRNLLRSTRAACAYLKKLHGQFGTWPLALAGYNMGENGLAAAMELQEVDSYYDLYLSLETQQYVLKIAAVKMILEHPEKYGFILKKGDYYPFERHDRVRLNSPGRLNLNIIARATDTVFKEIKMLNPELRGYFLCEGNYDLAVPKGKGKGFNKRFQKLLTTWNNDAHQIYHVVKKGENLTMIARRYKLSLVSLLQWNQLTFKSYIHPGDVLVVGFRGKKK